MTNKTIEEQSLLDAAMDFILECNIDSDGTLDPWDHDLYIELKHRAERLMSRNKMDILIKESEDLSKTINIMESDLGEAKIEQQRLVNQINSIRYSLEKDYGEDS